MEDKFLKKTFTQLTMDTATIQQNNKQSKEDNKYLTNIIRSTDLEKVTIATREGFNNTNILKSRERLENFLLERDKTLKKKLWSKLKTYYPLSKNIPCGSYQKTRGNLKKRKKFKKLKEFLKNKNKWKQALNTQMFKRLPQNFIKQQNKSSQMEKKSTKQQQKEKRKSWSYKTHRKTRSTKKKTKMIAW